MTEPPVIANSDAELLDIVRTVLEGQGFAVEALAGHVDMLLAENAYFIVGVAATPTIHELLVVEGAAEAALAERLSTSDTGPKRWDAYLVLLTQERTPDSDAATRGLFAINYDTARLRRIAHSGVDPTPEAVGHALAPFVAPIELSDPSISDDPFRLLVGALAARGVDRELANRAVSAFEQGAPLDNVL